MPRSPHLSAGTVHASGNSDPDLLMNPVELSGCLLSWWQAHGLRDPVQKLWLFKPAGGWPEADHQLNFLPDGFFVWLIRSICS